MNKSNPTFFQAVFSGWVMITAVYFLTMIVSFHFYSKPGTGLNWEMTNPTAFWMITIPYICGGLYCRFTGRYYSREYPLLVSIIPVIAERVLILLIGYRLYVSGGDGSMGGVTLLTFIRGEAVPFFTPSYIFAGGVVSILITIAFFLFKHRSNRKTFKVKFDK